MFKCFSISQKNERPPSPVLDLRDSIFSNPLPPTTQPTVFWQTVPSNKHGVSDGPTAAPSAGKQDGGPAEPPPVPVPSNLRDLEHQAMYLTGRDEVVSLGHP